VKKEINLYEKILLEKIRQNDKSAFTIVFSNYYRDLTLFAFNFTKDKDIAEEIVQEVFVKFWENKNVITIESSLKSFLLKSVQNKCIDWLRHLKSRDKFVAESKLNLADFENNTEEYLLWSDLSQTIEILLNKLPDELSLTFRLNRYDGLKYVEIAEKLNVSVRTIEVRIGKALHLLRSELKDYIPFFLFLITIFL
jgi:RNA polymerase sigma-70 factor (ECF subfamily)